jgi:hypothetical protein
VPVIGPDDETVAFEFDTPGSGPQLRAVFSVEKMMIEGELEI